METVVLFIVAFGSGYVVAVNTWALIRRWMNDIEAEAERLRAQAGTLLAKAKPPAAK